VALPDLGNERSFWCESVELLGKDAEVDFAFVDLKALVVEAPSIDNVDVRCNGSEGLDSIGKGQTPMVACKFGVSDV
jgi:hypothetical protein